MEAFQVKVLKLHPDAQLPIFKTIGAAGADLYARLDEPVTLEPLGRQVISTGLAMEVPIGYEIQIRARSGLSTKYGITMINGIGTVDSDYRGEIGIPLVNLSQEAFVVEPGMRIAQMVVAQYVQFAWDEVETLSETDRGAGGYGSSGHH